MKPCNVILPVAGFGRRFREAGYREEKPLIEVGGKTFLGWSVFCLAGISYSQVLIVNRPDQPGNDFVREAEKAGLRGGTEITVAGPTQGAACSVLAAAVGLPPDEPVLVMNCDQVFRCDLKATLNRAELGAWDGFILTFPGREREDKFAWSYAVTNGDDRVVAVLEKKPVSDYATVGVYWWRRTKDLVRSICAMVASGQRTNNEFYLAPAYEFAPLADLDVRIVPVDEFHGLGTPEQVREFEALLASGWKP